MRFFKLSFLKKNKFWLFVAFMIFSQLLYWFWLRKYVIAYFEPTIETTWFSTWVESIYPRLKVEKHRFEVSFFIKKSDQIAIRFFFLGTLFSVFLLPVFYTKIKSFFKKNTVYTQKISLGKQQFFVLYFLLSNVLLSNEWLEILTEYSQIANFYEPISFYKITSPSFPSLTFLSILFYSLRFISIIGVCLFLLSVFFQDRFSIKKIAFVTLILSAVFFIYLQGFLYGFGKIEHTYATWNWVCLLLPFWFYHTNFKNNNAKHHFVYQNYLLFIAIGLVYTSSGLEKLFIGGIEWLNGNALSEYLKNSPTHYGQYLSNYPVLIFLLSVLTIAWESCFLLILSQKKHIRLALIFVGICFHVGVYFFLGVGHYLSPWIWVYVFLL